MLAEYTAADRARILEDLRYVSVPQVDTNQLNSLWNEESQQEEEANVKAKASALFVLLGK